MRVDLVAPPPADLPSGNNATARRWAAILRELGHRPRLRWDDAPGDADLLIALHAVKTRRALLAFRRAHPDRPAVVALTGTDIYGRRNLAPALDAATFIVALQPRALTALSRAHRVKARVIFQSAEPPRALPAKPSREFRVAVVGHLRAVKDPLRTALAVRELPEDSRIVVRHAGRALSESFARRARAEMDRNPRYRWLGELTPGRVRRLIASSHLVAITSLAEGSCNVLSEALAAHTPVVATRIPGLMGTLGAHYPGYFRPRDTRKLTRLLRRAEGDAAFYRQLAAACRRATPLVDPRRERAAWRALLAELAARRP